MSIMMMSWLGNLKLVNYLTATGVDDGLLINFGSEELQFKRKFRVYRKRFS